MNGSIPILLVIAGSDSIGGAGLQADIKTACAFDVYTQCVVTAITAQNSNGVVLSEPVSEKMLRLQLETVLNDFLPDAVKIGMIPNAESVRIIADILKDNGVSNIVTDPVLAPTSGNSLNDDKEALGNALKKYLFPISSLVTPNFNELIFLTGNETLRTVIECDSNLSNNLQTELLNLMCCDAMVLKGGHCLTKDGLSTDFLIRKRCHISTFPSERLSGINFHGTGCVFATSAACMLAKGASLETAVETAHSFVHFAMTGAKTFTCPGASMLDFTVKGFNN